MFLSLGLGRLSFRPDLALKANLLFFDIMKLERVALLSMDTSAAKQTFSWSWFSSFFLIEAFLSCFSFAALSSFASWLEASSAGAALHIRHVALPTSSERHFSFLCCPQLPAKWKPFNVCVEEGSFVNLFAPKLTLSSKPIFAVGRTNVEV